MKFSQSDHLAQGSSSTHMRGWPGL
jgi:hypothetical protein